MIRGGSIGSLFPRRGGKTKQGSNKSRDCDPSCPTKPAANTGSRVSWSQKWTKRSLKAATAAAASDYTNQDNKTNKTKRPGLMQSMRKETSTRTEATHFSSLVSLDSEVLADYSCDLVPEEEQVLGNLSRTEQGLQQVQEEDKKVVTLEIMNRKPLKVRPFLSQRSRSAPAIMDKYEAILNNEVGGNEFVVFLDTMDGLGHCSVGRISDTDDLSNV